MSEDYIGTLEAAKLIGISRVTLWRLVKASKIPVYETVTGRKVFKRSELEAIKEPRRLTPTA